MKIRAAVLDRMGAPAPYAHSRPIRIATLTLEDPGPGEILVEIKAAGLCHSDLSVINGNRPRVMPMALGHEAAGIVRRLGAGVSHVDTGDHVVMVFVPSCGHCEPCAIGRPALCEPGNAANGAGTLLSGARRISESGAPINHHLGVSAFAEAAVVSARSVVRVDKGLAFDEAALFGCAVLTGAGAVINTARVRAGQSVAIVGLGGVGLAALLAAKAAGARAIVGIDVSDAKLALARELGATDVFNATLPDCAAVIRKTCGPVDVAIETAGATSALELAYAIGARGGLTVTAGLAHPTHQVRLPQASIVAEERTLKGSYVGSCVPLRDISHYVALYRAGRLPVARLLSERVTLDGLNEAFDRLAQGQVVRQVLML